MCAPTNLPRTFGDFKKSLTSQELHSLELMNFEILNLFVGQPNHYKKAFMERIPNIYRDILLQARKLLKLEDEKITLQGLDAKIESILMEVANVLKGNPVTLSNIESVSAQLWSSIGQLKIWLENNSKLLEILENHLSQIKCFSSRFNGDVVPSSDNKLFDSKPAPISGSSSSSSSSNSNISSCSTSNLSSTSTYTFTATTSRSNQTFKRSPLYEENLSALRKDITTNHSQGIFKSGGRCYLDTPASAKEVSNSNYQSCGDI